MRGEFLGVWSEMRKEIWQPLVDHDDVPADIFCELYRELAKILKSPKSIEDIADVIDDPIQSREEFEKTTSDDLVGEQALAAFLETAHPILDDLGGDELSNRYFNLLETFIYKFSLRYDLRRPCVICPTLQGIFASLVRALTTLGESDANVAKRLRDFKESIQDLRYGSTEGRIANCVSKQVMLLEAVASAAGASGTDLSALCKGIVDWPHPAVKSSLLSLYGFASDFPGLRHGTPSVGMARDIDMRDMIAMPILLTGFTPYLERRLSPNSIYGGSSTNPSLSYSVQPPTTTTPGNLEGDGRAYGFLGRLLSRISGRRL